MVTVAGICRDINWPDGLKGEVVEAIEYEQMILSRVNRKGRGLTAGYLAAISLMLAAAVLIFTIPEGVIAWFIAAFILYSFNFVILFLPTTRKGERDDSCRRSLGRDAVAPIRFLVRRKFKLALEVGITLFLGGMVPLALSFFIIFGLGLFLTLYFAFFAGAMSTNLAWLVTIQAVIIIVFFAVVVFARPQSQGFTDMARSLKASYDRAKGRSRFLQSLMLMAMGAIALGIIVLFFGAILLTGSVLGEVIYEGERVGISLLLILLVLIIQVVVMRHFQVVSSRRMARTVLELRLEALRKDVLEPLSAMLEKGKYADKEIFDRMELERIKLLFFSVVMYEVFEFNFFGYSPVYLVGPNVKYLIDERVLPYLGNG